MPLFPRSSSAQGPEGDYALQCHKRLSKALFQHGIGRRLQSQATGKKHFQHLIRDHGEAVVQTILDWYIPRIGQRYMPKVSSAFDFNDRFNEIWQVYERDHTQVKISDQAQHILDRLRYAPWPEMVEEVLPAVCQRSLENYEPFRASWEGMLRDLRKTFPKEEEARFVASRRKTLLEHLFTHHLWVPVDFVTLWVQNAPVIGWRFWTQMAFSSDSDRFHRMGRDWTRAYMGESKWWDSLWQLYREGA